MNTRTGESGDPRTAVHSVAGARPASPPRGIRRPVHERIDAVKQRITITAVVGRVVKLRRTGREYTACCPFHTENTPSFTVVEDKGFAHCFGCGWHGDIIRFVMEYHSTSFNEALTMLESNASLEASSASTRARSAKPAATNSCIDSASAARIIWREAGGAHETPVEAWLKSRGINPAATAALSVLQFHPRCPINLWPADTDHRRITRTAPAMIAPIIAVSGQRGDRKLTLQGIHITYLSADGRTKADLGQAAARRIWGNLAHGAVLIPGKPFDPWDDVPAQIIRHLDAPGPCAVGEGIESALSFAARLSNPRLICATLSLGNLEGSQEPIVVDDRSAIPLWRSDPSAYGTPFLFNQPGDVAIGVDNDMKPTAPIWVQEAKGAPLIKRALSGEERAQRCATLSAARWRSVGASTVDAMLPPAGCDFNDLDQKTDGKS